MSAKSELRSQARKRRAALARATPDHAERLARHTQDLAIPGGSVVGGYLAMGDEADPRLLLDELAARLCIIALPRVTAKSAPLSFHRLQPGREPVRSRLGMLEPAPDWPLAHPTVLLVPLLAFDAHGHRLGYGGGFYDRTLDAMRAGGRVLAIGVAYAGQEVPLLPREAHDHPLDAVITENGLRRFG